MGLYREDGSAVAASGTTGSVAQNSELPTDQAAVRFDQAVVNTGQAAVGTDPVMSARVTRRGNNQSTGQAAVSSDRTVVITGQAAGWTDPVVKPLLSCQATVKTGQAAVAPPTSQAAVATGQAAVVSNHKRPRTGQAAVGKAKRLHRRQTPAKRLRVNTQGGTV